MSKPAIVLAHGAWHTPEAFGLVTKRLEDAGYSVHGRKLPSVGNDNPPEDLSQDITAVQELVTEAIGDGNDVIVIPHSWAGIIVASALSGWGKKEREERGLKGGVVKFAYICAFMIPENVSLMDAIQHQVPHWWDFDGPYTIANDPNVFYNDLSREEQQKWMSKLETHAYATKKAKSTAAAWKEIPTWYLVCEDDNAIPVAAQEAMVDGAKAMGADVQAERIKASHSPFLSQPDVVANWVRRAAGEKL
ncbi:alpha/beta-hydrolase [Corynespora cassiicola Philippines]|uniref:Alpha/beta-hydrolase n=1 Tax=Corynespora cassiicola Philippines TaxID=1448308 RepID=A0A2T2N4G0_CORCC|nr:alpha/beta-hydrolase [Corynespora cassiicola Philippines]